MRTSSRALLLLAALAATSGCTYRQVLERLAPAEDVTLARELLEHVRAGRIAEVERQLDPAEVRPDTGATLAQLSRVFPPGEPRSVELIGANVGQGPRWRSANLSFQYEFDDGWVAANVLLRREEGRGVVVAGMHATRLRASLQSLHAFTLRGKPAAHLAFLLAAALVAAFVLAMAIACARDRELPRRWRWFVFVLLGVGGVTLDWTSGAVAFTPISVHLLGTGAKAASPYAPWLLTVSFPLGAVLYLVKRVRRPAAPAEPAPGAGAHLDRQP